jgi:hypothetical protein
MKHSIRFCILPAILLLALPLQAREPAPWYDVEMIVYANREAGGGTELWPSVTTTPDWSSSVRLAPAPATESGLIGPYTLLTESEHRLTAEWHALKRTHGRLDPLLHVAWSQPVSSGKRADTVFLQSFIDPASTPTITSTPPELEGTVKLSINRYLHVELDLLLHEKSAEPLSIGESLFAPAVQSYRLNSHRRMRSGELHYIDHPRMGVLITAHPHEFAETLTEEAAEPSAAPGTDGMAVETATTPAVQTGDSVPQAPAGASGNGSSPGE